MEIMYCNVCGKEVDLSKKPRETARMSRQRGYAYCSRECATVGATRQWTPERRKKASEQMKEQNTTDAFIKQRQSMKTNNPMNNPEVRKKVSETLRRKGHKRPVKGGNGT